MINSQFYKYFTFVSIFHICFLQVYTTSVPLYCLLQDRHYYTTSSKYVNQLYIEIQVRIIIQGFNWTGNVRCLLNGNLGYIWLCLCPCPRLGFMECHSKVQLRAMGSIPFRTTLYSWRYIHVLCILTKFRQHLPCFLQVHVGQLWPREQRKVLLKYQSKYTQHIYNVQLYNAILNQSKQTIQ